MNRSKIRFAYYPPYSDTLFHLNRLCLTLRLPRWRRQRCDPPRHPSKERERQITFRQQQPVVTGTFTKRPPVFTALLQSWSANHLSIPAGKTSRRHRFPKMVGSPRGIAPPRLPLIRTPIVPPHFPQLTQVPAT